MDYIHRKQIMVTHPLFFPYRAIHINKRSTTNDHATATATEIPWVPLPPPPPPPDSLMQMDGCGDITPSRWSRAAWERRSRCAAWTFSGHSWSCGRSSTPEKTSTVRRVQTYNKKLKNAQTTSTDLSWRSNCGGRVGWGGGGWGVRSITHTEWAFHDPCIENPGMVRRRPLAIPFCFATAPPPTNHVTIANSF